jgi:hypothetical protein
VPVVDHPSVGTDRERAALAELQEWREKVAATLARPGIQDAKNEGSAKVLAYKGQHLFHYDDVFAFWADRPSLDGQSVDARLYLRPLKPNSKEGREVRCRLRPAALDALEKHGAKRLPEPIPNKQ